MAATAAILKINFRHQAFVNDICSRLDALEQSSDVDESWTVFRDTVHSSAMDSLGPVSRKHQDWFDENGESRDCLLLSCFSSDTSNLIGTFLPCGRRCVYTLKEMDIHTGETVF